MVKYIFVAVYLLVLVTQLPHVWYAYAAIEVEGFRLAQITAIGVAVAFESAIGIFTYRIIKGSRRKWTRRGLAFFIIASVAANGFYYGWLSRLFDTVWPAFATVALPIALALFAEEFGMEVKRTERQRKKAEGKLAQTEPEPAQTEPEPAPQFATKREHVHYLVVTEPGITQTELAMRSGASASYVSELVRNGNEQRKEEAIET